MKWTLLLLAFFIFIPGVSVHAATCRFDVSANSISLIPADPIDGVKERIYFTVNHNCSFDVEAIAQFFVDGTLVVTKAVSVKQNGKPEEVWASWTPDRRGDHVISVRIISDGSAPDLETPPEIKSSIFVDIDTDKDQVGNQMDLDDDNDQVLDTQDRFPLDPTRSKDADGDGIDDANDIDDDNDGLLDTEEAKLGTDPLKRDTDGDGVGDKEDAYPLDPTRSKVPPPPPPAPKPTPKPPIKSNPMPVTSASPITQQTVDLTATDCPDPPACLSFAQTLGLTNTDQPIATTTVASPSLQETQATLVQKEPRSSSWISDILKTIGEHLWVLGVVVLGLGAAGWFFWLSKQE